MHYPKIDIDRLYLPRTSGGRGLTQVVTALKTKPIGLIGENKKIKKLYSIQKEVEKFRQELDVQDLEKGKINKPLHM